MAFDQEDPENVNELARQPKHSQPVEKFLHPDLTAKGEPRARVSLVTLDMLWINTGTLCNITCQNCYIESSPVNDRLAYISRAEARAFFDEIKADGLATREIGFTGGEPFLNPDMLGMVDDALSAGFSVLLLTNAMQPMQRPKIKAGLLKIKDRYGDRLTMRVSLDHHSAVLHEAERGKKTWAKALAGLDWLAENGFRMAIAGRTCWQETEEQARAGYASLIASRKWPIDPQDHVQLNLLPEMEMGADVPEITEACWDILNKSPSQMMCASSRMVVKRKGAEKPTVLPCTLIPYDERFDMGSTLRDADRASGGMFDKGDVKLCHVHCAKFCVLGGGSCS
jgi:organic radical activating enzyme